MPPKGSSKKPAAAVFTARPGTYSMPDGTRVPMRRAPEPAPVSQVGDDYDAGSETSDCAEYDFQCPNCHHTLVFETVIVGVEPPDEDEQPPLQRTKASRNLAMERQQTMMLEDVQAPPSSPQRATRYTDAGEITYHGRTFSMDDMRKIAKEDPEFYQELQDFLTYKRETYDGQ